MESTSTDREQEQEPVESESTEPEPTESEPTESEPTEHGERQTTNAEHDVSQYDSADEAPDDLLEEIEQEREERLDPDNRPEGAEVDNTDRTFVVEHGRFEDSDVDEELGPFRTEDEA